MSATKFKVGDRVRVKEASKIICKEIILAQQLSKLWGKEVEIVYVDSTSCRIVHNGAYWWLDFDMLEPITPAHRWTVGQPVWDDVNHKNIKGSIDEVLDDGNLWVTFSDKQYYYPNNGNKIRFLSAVPYTFELPPQPDPIWIPEKWERVLVRDGERYPWYPHVFDNYSLDNGDYKYRVLLGKIGFKYCIPFDPDKVGKV